MGSTIDVTFIEIGSSHNRKQEGIEFGALPKVMLMTNQNCLASACRYCRFYSPEGLRGGACQQLGVSVQSDWTACQLALPAFASTWENAEELATANWQVEIPQVLQRNNMNSVVAGLDLAKSPVGVNN
jgi:hypothetical protein